CQQVYSNPRTF
nr:immunoglobulin light chain junction region [Macaca mulatta]